MPDLSWQHDAACLGKGPEMFFPTQGEADPRAHTLCDQCPVRQDCLEHALRHEPFGTWAGTSERQRKRMRAAAHITLQELTIDIHAPRPGDTAA